MAFRRGQGKAATVGISAFSRMKVVRRVLPVGWLLVATSFAFTTPRATLVNHHRHHSLAEQQQQQQQHHHVPFPSVFSWGQNQRLPSSQSFTTSSTCLHMSSIGIGIGSIVAPLVSPLVFKVSALSTRWGVSSVVLAASACLAFLFNARRILFPRASKDATYRDIPLPPGSLGCPFFGKPFFLGSEAYGPGSFYRATAKKLKWKANIFKYYFMGTPFVAVGGMKNLQKLLSQEFGALQTASGLSGGFDSLMGVQSLVMEKDKSEHQFLRRLVGQALTPSAVADSLPTLQAAAEAQVNKLLLDDSGRPISMGRVCTDFTLDVAWKQILGLNLKEEEIPTFMQAVDDWAGGMVSPRSMLNFRIKESKAYKALQYLQSKVQEKIDSLERDGPDASTLSGMVFATDDDVPAIAGTGAGRSPSRKLTRAQVVDNAMLLIIAGSETSASTLTNAMMCLGLHKDTAWKKLVEEQRIVQAKFGNTLTKEALDSKVCPYLEAVIKESLRIRPISGGFPRVAKETMFFNDPSQQKIYQIPKGWVVDWSVPLTHELDPVTFQEDGSHMDLKKGFIPERWLQEETTPTDFIPMGAGPRYCLGSNLAYGEMKVFLAVMARNLDFELAGNNDKILWKRMGIIPKLKDGVPVTVQPVQQQQQQQQQKTSATPVVA